MIKSPKYGQQVFYRNTGTASAVPIIGGKIDCAKPIGEYWVVMNEFGRRKLLLNEEMFISEEQLIKEGCL